MSQLNFPVSSINVLFDIDGTLTDDVASPQIDSRYVMGNALFELFAEHLYKTGINREQASEALHKYSEKNKYWDYNDFVKEFRIQEPDIWKELSNWHQQNLRIFEDGKSLANRLFKQGFPLHIVSNNPYHGCLLKLEAAGLGTLQGSELFDRIFCSNHQQGQKHDLRFWERVISSSGFDPAHTVIIGNNLHEDYEVPGQMGFHSSYIVDREKSISVPSRSDSGLHIVHSLLEVEFKIKNASFNLIHN
ncbi:HAD family hydrolase [Kiritimatiellaeota bacterium B1221]|nr:HAD family hydrolase [Kiritimatiellaeota bacterium B1221]